MCQCADELPHRCGRVAIADIGRQSGVDHDQFGSDFIGRAPEVAPALQRTGPGIVERSAVVPIARSEQWPPGHAEHMNMLQRLGRNPGMPLPRQNARAPGCNAGIVFVGSEQYGTTFADEQGRIARDLVALIRHAARNG